MIDPVECWMALVRQHTYTRHYYYHLSRIKYIILTLSIPIFWPLLHSGHIYRRPTHPSSLSPRRCRTHIQTYIHPYDGACFPPCSLLCSLPQTHLWFIRRFISSQGLPAAAAKKSSSSAVVHGVTSLSHTEYISLYLKLTLPLSLLCHPAPVFLFLS